MYHVNHYTLPDLVDLALISPERGAVNFNILHLVLKCMLKELGIEHVRPWCQLQNPQLKQAAHTKLKLEEKLPPETPLVRKATSAPESSLFQKPHDPKQPPVEFLRAFTFPEATLQKQLEEKPLEEPQVQQQPTVEYLQASTPPETTTGEKLEVKPVEEPQVQQQPTLESLQASTYLEAITEEQPEVKPVEEPPPVPQEPPTESVEPSTPPEATTPQKQPKKEEPVDELPESDSIDFLRATLTATSSSEEAIKKKKELRKKAQIPVIKEAEVDELHTRRIDAGWDDIEKKAKQHYSFKKKENKKADLQKVDHKLGSVEEAWRYSHLRTTVDTHEEIIMRHNEILDLLADRIKKLESKRREATGGKIGGPVRGAKIGGGKTGGPTGGGRIGGPTGGGRIGGGGIGVPTGGGGIGVPTGGVGIDESFVGRETNGSITGGEIDELPDDENSFDLIADMDELEERIEALEEAREGFEKDHERLNTTSRILERVVREFKEIKGIREKIKRMEDDISSKMEKTEMVEALEKKADRALVDSKVDRLEFETAIDELGEAITLLRLKFQRKVDEWEDAYKELWDSLEGKMTREIFDEGMAKMEVRVVALMRALAMIKKLVDEVLYPDAGGISRCMSCKRPAKESGRELYDEKATKRPLKSSESSSKDSPQISPEFEGSQNILKEASTKKPEREEPPYPSKKNISIYMPSPPDFSSSPSPDIRKKSSDVSKSSKGRFTIKYRKDIKSSCEPLKFTNMKLEILKREKDEKKTKVTSLEEEKGSINVFEPPELSLESVTASYKSASAMSITNESTKDFKIFPPTQYRNLLKQDDQKSSDT